METPPPERDESRWRLRAREGPPRLSRVIALIAWSLGAAVGLMFLFGWLATPHIFQGRQDKKPEIPLAYRLFDADRLLVDGYTDDADEIYGKVLYGPAGNAEAIIRGEFCLHAMLGTAQDALRYKVEALLDGDVPPALRELVEAELLVMEGDIEGAHDHFEAALAESGDRIRYAILHRVDHMREWSATSEFCLSVRMPEVDNRRVLRRFAFRPYVPLYLSLYVCTPAGDPRLVYPRAGVDEDVAVPAGECLVEEPFKDTGEWVHLPEDQGMFLCGVVTRKEPDRDEIAKILSEAIGAATAAEASGMTFEETLLEDLVLPFGSDRFVLITPQF